MMIKIDIPGQLQIERDTTVPEKAAEFRCFG